MVLGPGSGRTNTVGDRKFDGGCFRVGAEFMVGVSFSGLLHAMKGGGEEEGDGGQDPNLRGYKYQRSEESTVRHQSGRIERAEKTHFYSNEFLLI